MANDTSSYQVLDYMARDYDSILKSMREQVPNKLPEWTDFESESDFGNVLLQLFAHMGDILSYYQDRIANESFLGTARERRSIINHLQLIGYRLSTAAPAAVKLTLNIPADCNDIVTLYKGNAFAAPATKERAAVRYEYTGENETIDCSSLSIDSESGFKTFQFLAEEGRFIQDEVIGVSDGTPNQRFSLGYAGLILRSFSSSEGERSDIQIDIDLDGVVKTWRLQSTLAFSMEDREEYSIDIDENDFATITFGDGAFGKIPPANAEIRASYRIGGGGHGNLPKKSIDTIIDAPDLALIGAKVAHKEAATGGSDRESIEHATAHAPNVFRSLNRAVTKADYEALAVKCQGVGKVRAEKTNWNTVTLYIAPQGGGYMSDILKSDLRDYFADKRSISTTVEFDDVKYVPIYVTANVTLQGYYSQTEKKREIEAAVAELLAFDQIDFGDPVYLSKFYEKIEQVEGVEFATVTEFRREEHDALETAPLGKIELEPYELAEPVDESPYVDGIQVIIQGGY